MTSSCTSEEVGPEQHARNGGGRAGDPCHGGVEERRSQHEDVGSEPEQRDGDSQQLRVGGALDGLAAACGARDGDVRIAHVREVGGDADACQGDRCDREPEPSVVHRARRESSAGCKAFASRLWIAIGERALPVRPAAKDGVPRTPSRVPSA